MKHVHIVSKGLPASAIFTDNHPGLWDSILGFILNPVQVLLDHIEFIFKG